MRSRHCVCGWISPHSHNLHEFRDALRRWWSKRTSAKRSMFQHNIWRLGRCIAYEGRLVHDFVRIVKIYHRHSRTCLYLLLIRRLSQIVNIVLVLWHVRHFDLLQSCTNAYTLVLIVSSPRIVEHGRLNIYLTAVVLAQGLDSFHYAGTFLRHNGTYVVDRT